MSRRSKGLVALSLAVGLLASCDGPASSTDANSGASGSAMATTNTPTFAPAGGTYAGAQTVSLRCATTGATIWYTTDGTAPSTSSTRYVSAFQVSSSRTVKAIATCSGMNSSATATAKYVIQ